MISKPNTTKLLSCVIALMSSKLIANPNNTDFIAPSMVNIPAGTFMMGSDTGKQREAPRHSVSLPNFQIGKYMVTVAEFRKFAEDTKFEPKQNCIDNMDRHWFGGYDKQKDQARWDKNRYQKSDYQPVTCVTFDDAVAYAKWLSDKTGVNYRLPTEQEWEYAARGNTTSRYFWGDDFNWTQACHYGNFADQSSEYFGNKLYGASYVGFIGHVNCDDGEPFNSIVGLYRPNPFGLYDMVGNVKQFVDTCYYDGYQARTEEEMDQANCEKTAFRGTIWHFTPESQTIRGGIKKSNNPNAILGFRLATDGHSNTIAPSTKQFEKQLITAQSERIATRPRIPTPAQMPILKKATGDMLELSWLASKDKTVVGYEIYQSKQAHAHRLAGFYQDHYEKIDRVPANQHTLKIKSQDPTVSFRVVAKTKDESSLPSRPAFIANHKPLTIPGRLELFNATKLENAHLRQRGATAEREALTYLVQYTGPEQIVTKAHFEVNVEKSGWYTLNYWGKRGGDGEFFKLWRGNKLLAKVNYTQEVDDKTSKRHRVFLEAGRYPIEMSVVRETPDRWYMVWLSFTEDNA